MNGRDDGTALVAERAHHGAQAASSVLMVRPVAFRGNELTMTSNRFQSRTADPDPEATAERACREFDGLAAALGRHGIDVHVFAGRTTSDLPDEVFPNNWLSTHADGTVVLYPMMALNRRGERRRDLLDALQMRAGGFRIERVVDLSDLESRGRFLEGTGSLVFDHENRTAFACLSPRTNAKALSEFAQRLDYEIVAFEAADAAGHAIYHTNVMLALGTRFAVVCLEAIQMGLLRYYVVSRIEKTGREVIDVSLTQIREFAANLLELSAPSGNIIALSSRAASALTDSQHAALARHGTLVAVPVDTIETTGGGSVRCMLAEIFLPRKR